MGVGGVVGSQMSLFRLAAARDFWRKEGSAWSSASA